MKTILATTSSFGTASADAAEVVRNNGYELVTNPYGRKLTEEELIELLAKHRPIGLLAGTEPVTAKVIEGAAEHLQFISRIGVGWDNVDHDKAQELNIPVYRTEGVLTQAVAELTLGYILDALRHISAQNNALKNGTWKKRMGSLLSGKTIGIIGFGEIGKRVGELCSAFGATVSCADICELDSACALQLPLKELLANSDILSINASGCDCFLDEEMLDCCKKGAIICNTARGGQIDETALAERLRDGRIGYACLDVYENEPYEGPLAGLENTILTPHKGSYAQEARIAMEDKAVANLFAGLNGK
jgi:D-3-phosphoglycerate dehydrogenase